MATTYPSEHGTISFETVTGTATEVRKQLKAGDDDQVVALTLTHGNPRIAQALAQALMVIAPLVLTKLGKREKEAMDKIVDALVPSFPPPQHLILEAQMNAEARTAALDSAEWLTAAQLSTLAGFNGQNSSAQPNKWKREGRIFAIRQAGNDYYPGYALDANAGYRPIKGLAPVLKRFDGALDEWDIATWFASGNSFLGGKTPMDLLQSEPELVLAAAEDEITGVRHG